jgi:hypothetical protein
MKISNRLTSPIALLVFLFSSIAAIFAEPQPKPAHAVESACVVLLVGAGYAAQIRLHAGDWATPYSRTFPVGKTECFDLSRVKNSELFVVDVKAKLGRTVSCPAIIKSPGKGSITFQAYGTTLKPKCVESRSNIGSPNL